MGTKGGERRLKSCWPPSHCRGMSFGTWGQGTNADKAGLALLGKSPAPSILWDEPKSPPSPAAGAGKPEPAVQHPLGDAGQALGFQPRLGCWIHHHAADRLKKTRTQKTRSSGLTSSLESSPQLCQARSPSARHRQGGSGQQLPARFCSAPVTPGK